MWEHKFGRLGISYQKILENEIDNYASIVREEKRLDIIYERHKRLMQRVGAEPDLLILPPESQIYLSMIPPEKTKYLTAGPDGVLMYKNGPKSLTRFRDGTNVFETRDFNVYENSPPIDLLTRAISISEYYGMLFKDWRNDEISNYQTRWRDTWLYDENKDDFVKIPFRDAFKHAKIFDKDGNYHSSLKKLVQSYNSEDRGSKYMHYEEDDDDDDPWGGMKMMKDKEMPPPFFLAAPSDDSTYFLIEYFGQMALRSATQKDFEQVGQSIVSHIFNRGMMGEEITSWHDLIRLIKEIESQSYIREYWLALIEANEPFSINNNGDFTGEMTPEDLLEYWGISVKIKEWKPNSMGSLILPNDKERLKGVEYPAGFANAPGFQTLAKEANNPDSHWYDLGKRAANALDLLNRMVSALKQYLPTSEALQSENRSPWFHRSDALTVFFENLVSIPRDPIWIAALPPVMADPGDPNKRHVRGKTSGGTNGNNNKILWFPIPLFITSLDVISRNDIQGLTALLEQIYDGDLPDYIQQGLERGSQKTDNENIFVYKSIVTNKIREIPERYLFHTAIIPREIKVNMLMGKKSVIDLNKIFDAIDDNKNYPLAEDVKEILEREAKKKKLRNKMLDFIMTYISSKGNTTSKLRQIVRGIAFDVQNPEQLFKTIDIISITTESSRDAMKNAREKINRLISFYKDEDDDDIFAHDTPLQPPGFKTFSSEEDEEDIPSINQLSYSEVKESIEILFDLADDIVAIILTINDQDPIKKIPFSMVKRKQNKWLNESAFPPIPEGDEDDKAKVAEYEKLAELYAKKFVHFEKLMIEIDRKIDKLIPKIQDKEEWRAEADHIFKEKVKFSVQDDERAVFRSIFYRSPLTASLSLLQSLSSEGSIALIRPSDPRTSHTSAYVEETEGKQKRHILLPDEIWKRAQYADIASIHHDRQVKKLDHLNFINRHIKTTTISDMEEDDDFSDADMYRRSGSGATATATTMSKSGFSSRKRTLFDDFGDDDDDDDGDDDYALSKVFGEYRSSKARKTSHVDSFNIGGKFGQSHKTEEWTKQSLKKGRHGGQYAFSQSGIQYSEEYKEIHTATFDHRWKQSNNIADPFVRLCVQTFLLSHSHGRQWLLLIDNDIHVLCNLILWRNFIEHDMASAILMKGGLETGANLYGHSNFATGNDVVSKMIYGNYTFYSKAIVWRERNISIIENIKPVQYRGGNNTRFMIRKKDLQEEDRSRPSIIVTAIPITENELPWLMSFTGKLEIPDMNDTIDGKSPISYSTFEYYDNEIWQIGRRIQNDNMGRDSFFERPDRMNVHALQGFQYLYNRSSRQYDKVIDAKSHRGRNGSYPGAAKVWNGNFAYLKDYDFTQKKLD